MENTIQDNQQIQEKRYKIKDIEKSINETIDSRKTFLVFSTALEAIRIGMLILMAHHPELFVDANIDALNKFAICCDLVNLTLMVSTISFLANLNVAKKVLEKLKSQDIKDLNSDQYNSIFKDPEVGITTGRYVISHDINDIVEDIKEKGR